MPKGIHNNHHTGPIVYLFWRKVDKKGPIHPIHGRCWVWTGSKVGKGYGQHRRSWKIHFGEIPDGLYVLHKCDNPLCVNPSHLFLGTPKDNVQDMLEKGRGNFTGPINPAKGNRHGSKTHPERVARGDNAPTRKHPESYPKGEERSDSKLTEKDVKEIRSLYAEGNVSQYKLAAKYSVYQGTISDIILRKSWKHI